MGVTIHYRGRLRNPADITAVVAEIVDIARTLGWGYHAITKELVGISVDPHPDCDSLLLLFDGEGKLSNRFSCKTQFAPASVHVAIVRLLRHLGKRWFAAFEVEDEGGFWETGDLQELERRLGVNDRAPGRLEKRPRGSKMRQPEEDHEDLETRIERILREHEDRPIRLTDEEHRTLTGPEMPDPEEIAGWSVEDWIENFERQDDDKWPMIRAMRNRKVTEKNLKEAARFAEDEVRRFEATAVKFLASLQHPLNQKEEQKDVEFDELEPVEEPWKASLPAFEPEESRPDADKRYKLGLSFALQLDRRVFGTRRIHPALSYAMELMHSSVVGIRMGAWWERVAGTGNAMTARRRIGAERFRTIARLLRSFPRLKLEEFSKKAEKVARVFAKES